MAEIIENEGGKQKGKKRAKKQSTHIDMTPMVDLACLLLTFFMLTTQFSKPKVMDILLPEDTQNEEESPQVEDERALNIILIEGDKVLWYNGLADPTKASLPTLHETDFSDEGIRKVLLQRNKDLYIQINDLETAVLEGELDLPSDSVNARILDFKRKDKNSPVVLIKASENVKYRNIVDILDEMAITNIASYALVDINIVEEKMVSDYFKQRATGAAGASSNK